MNYNLMHNIQSHPKVMKISTEPQKHKIPKEVQYFRILSMFLFYKHPPNLIGLCLGLLKYTGFISSADQT